MHLSRRAMLRLLATGPLVAGCGLPAPASPARPPAGQPATSVARGPSATRAPRTIQIVVGFGTGNAPPQLPVQEELATAYTDRRRGEVRIEYLRVASSTEGRQRLPEWIATGQPPDIVLPSGRFGIFALADQDLWLDLSPFFRQTGLTLSIYPQAVQEAAQALGFYPGPGQIIGLPAGFHTHTLAFNKDLFARAKLPEPPPQWNTPEWTYAKLRELAMKLTLDGAGRNATEPGFDPKAIVQWGLGNFFPTTIWYAYGGRRYDPRTRQVRFDDPEAALGVRFAADLATRDRALLIDAIATRLAGPNGQRALWRSGKVAMVDMCSCELAGYGDITGFRWDVAAIPKGPKRLFNFLNVDVGSLVKAGRDHATAWDVLKFMTLDEPNARHLQIDSYGAIPARIDSQAAFKEVLASRFPGVNAQLFLDAIPYAGGDNEDWVPNYAQVRALQNEAFDRLLKGETAVDEELPRLQADAQKAIDEWLAKFGRG